MPRRFGSDAMLSRAERQTLAVLDPLHWLSCTAVRHRVALQRATDPTVRRRRRRASSMGRRKRAGTMGRRRYAVPPERIYLDLLGLHTAGLVERCSPCAPTPSDRPPPAAWRLTWRGALVLRLAPPMPSRQPATPADRFAP